MCLAYAGNLASPGFGVVVEVVELDHRRYQRDLALGHDRDRRVVHPGAVLDAVDAGGHQLGDGLLAENVGGHPAAQFVGSGDRRRGELGRPQRSEITDLAVDPVAHELDPAVTPRGLALDLGHEFVRLDLGPVVAQIAHGSGDVPAGPDDLGQVVALVHPPGVGRAAGITQQQRAGGPLRESVLFGDVVGHRAGTFQTHMAVRVDQTGHQPASGDRYGVADRFGPDQPVDHPEVTPFTVRQHHTAEFQPGCHGVTLLAEAPAQLGW